MMRIIVTSDVHGRREKLFDIVERHYDTTDLFINLGDSENSVDDLLIKYPKIKMERVAGNCDFGSLLQVFGLINADGKKIMFCHGHHFSVKYGYELIEEKAKEINADICLFGHTHIPYVSNKDGIHYLNPGAVCNGSYGIIDITPNGIMLYNNTI